MTDISATNYHSCKKRDCPWLKVCEKILITTWTVLYKRLLNTVSLLKKIVELPAPEVQLIAGRAHKNLFVKHTVVYRVW